MQNRVTPSGELQVGDVLERARRGRPRPVERRERLRPDPGLPVHMRNGRRALQVGDVRRLRAALRVERPHRAHRHVGVRAHGEVVAELRSSVLERLGVVRHAAPMRFRRERAVVLVGEELGDRAPVVVQEAVGLRRAPHHVSGEGGEPRRRVVAAPACEVVEDRLRPVLRAGLDAVAEQCGEAGRGGCDASPSRIANRLRCVSRYARTRSPSSLSTSRPVASAGAGPFVCPVSDAPRRRTVQSPGGRVPAQHAVVHQCR